MVCEDCEKNKIVFPVVMLPKVDGVRALNVGRGLVGRSFKPHKNIATTSLYSHPIFTGLDGELAAGLDTSDSLCRTTTSVLNRANSPVIPDWYLFDYYSDETMPLGYVERHKALTNRVEEIRKSLWEVSLSVLKPVAFLDSLIKIIPMFIVDSMDELELMHNSWSVMGYEGSVLRSIDGLVKEGRSTVKEGGYLRIKDFVEEDSIVLKVVEGYSNLNEVKINELGNIERSSHKANKIPNGMVGMLICRDVKTGKIIEVSAGCMTHGEREYYFKNPNFILGKTIKYKHFPKGVLNKPRFATFQCFRIASDMVTF